jgi:D-alanyl-D-alanine dipeptidase
MNYRSFLTGIAAGLLLFVQTGLSSVEAAIPADAPKDIKYILGFYYGNGENILIRENKGRLELLYRFSMQDKCFDLANIYPLSKNHFDSYLMVEAGPMSNTEVGVKFERDPDGYGITCRVGGNRYTRYYFGQETGENAKLFRFPPVDNWEELRKQANEAVMPAALATGEAVTLVDVATIPNVKIENVYAGVDNIFGAPLYTVNKLYLGSKAVEALTKVQERLASKGYGLVVWDAYRPWAVSKLAHLALPADKKYMLEDPELKGNKHNTGNAVDLSLYDLETGEAIEMSSGFDEPSMRQYASYPGGTERQRYLRTMLRETMEEFGFTGIEMEWWHFEYDAQTAYAHQNIPLENLK